MPEMIRSNHAKLHSLSITCLAARLAPGAPGLEVQLLTPLLQGLEALLGPAGEVHVNGGPHAGAEVGGAGVDEAVLLGARVVLAGLGLHGVTHGLDAAGEAGEHSLDVSALLHGDDAGLVLLVDPHQEGLGVVVEDATALGPVALHASNLAKENSVIIRCL